MAYDEDNACIILRVRCPCAGETLPLPGIGIATIEYNMVPSSNVIFVVKATHHPVFTVITNTHIGIRSSSASSVIGTSHF